MVAILILVVMLAATVCDALRDAWVTRKWGISWRRWHLAKWAAFFPPMRLLAWFYFREVPWPRWVAVTVFLALVVACRLVWKRVYDNNL